MKIGLLRNYVSENSSKADQLTALGMNSGNLVFWEALQRLFDPIIIPYSESDKIRECDKIILTDLIWIRENAEYDYLEKLVDNFNISFIPMSIGLQSNYYKSDFEISKSTIRLLKKLEERAVLGVRGEYTADILRKNKIKNVSVIGCPSLYYWNNPDIFIESSRYPKNCSANFKTFYGELNIPEKHFLSYCASNKMQFVEQTSWPFKLENVKDKRYFEFVSAWLNKSLVLPCSYKEWCRYLKDIDFSIGGRFHGNVIALWNNIKSLFLTVDSRTKELTEFFRLPTIDMNLFDNKKPIEFYYEKADYSEFNKYYPSIYKNFCNFIDKNGLIFSDKATPLAFDQNLRVNKISNISIDIHFTEYRNPATIMLDSIIKEKNTIRYKFHTKGNFLDYISNRRPFTIEYDCNVESVPDSIAAVPFVALMLPMIWLMDATLEIYELDKNFYDSIENFKRGYELMYPSLNFKGQLIVHKIIKNTVDHNFRKSLCYFSGGVDATSTMLSNIQYRPTLFTIWGTDIYFEQPKAWEIVREKNKQIAEDFSLPYTTVKTSFRYILNERSLTRDFAKKVNENWWHGFMHGIALLAHAAPYAFINNITDINIASSYSVKDGANFLSCASYPTIDAMMEYCGCKIYHDGFEKSRTDKVRQIVKYAKEYNKNFFLRVCWEQITGENCCLCEKCQRTIFGLYAAGGDPNDYGFNLSDEKIEGILQSIRTKRFYNSVFWIEIKNSLYEQRQKYSNNKIIMELIKDVIPSK